MSSGFVWQCPRRESNPHAFWTHDFESCASTNSATRAFLESRKCKPKFKLCNTNHAYITSCFHLQTNCWKHGFICAWQVYFCRTAFPYERNIYQLFSYTHASVVCCRVCSFHYSSIALHRPQKKLQKQRCQL